MAVALKQKNDNEPVKQLKNIIKEAIKEARFEDKLTLTIEEAARYSGIGRDKLLELAHSEYSDFPCFRVGTKFLVNKTMLEEWLKQITEEGRVL